MLKFIAWMTNFLKKMDDDRVSAFAAQAAFFVVLSIFPFIIVLLTLLQYLPFTPEAMLESLLSLFSVNSGSINLSQIGENALSNGFDATSSNNTIATIITAIFGEVYGRASGALLSVTVIMLLWSAGAGILAITRGLNDVYDVKESRNYIFLRLLSAAYTLVFAILIIFTLGFLVFGSAIYQYLSAYLPDWLRNAALFSNSIKFTASLAILTTMFLLIYKVLPNRKDKLRHQLPGAVFTAFGWMISSALFSLYIGFSTRLSYMYGSLTGIIVMMLWLYLIMYIMFIGAELNSLLFPKVVENTYLRY